ncbi:RNA-directed DNA polymerase from mobile element jockey-like [Oopsacas minuta]|uniref:RNA-directed DNA polymerase from mobile element jockey-like n=1 Tax=Oopsacas minuta TaxID=111878 RepID=A0AAV7JMT1_9METZ|nr:RNA-directed DNA polymerase from mobile element jockey-like [Oopsacas minuta]
MNSLYPNEFSSYRPISNLPFMSKIVVKSIAIQLEHYLLENNLYLLKQSGYKIHHPTETVLIRAFNDLCCDLDEGRNTMLILLDLTAAFDTVDHEIIFEHLQTRFGSTTGKVLKWFR